MKYSLIICILILVAACKDAKRKEPEIKTVKEEQFSDFLEKFQTDSTFQVSRTQFPLNYWGYNEDPESPIGLSDSLVIKETITSESHYFLNLKENTGQDYDNYIVESFVEDNSALVTLSGVDNGISVEYHFAKINGLWYIVKIIDQST